MAAINQYVRFRDTPRVDGLCPKCFNPSLKLYILQRINWDGITNLGERVACADCHIWTTDLKEYDTHDAAH